MGVEMTKAYIQGFCKVAKAYGVDPGRLVKVAASTKQAQTVKRLFTTVRNAARMPLGDLERQVHRLGNAISAKEMRAAAHKDLGLLPEFATRHVGVKTRNIADVLHSVLLARGGKPYPVGGVFHLGPEGFLRREFSNLTLPRAKITNSAWFKQLIDSLAV